MPDAGARALLAQEMRRRWRAEPIDGGGGSGRPRSRRAESVVMEGSSAPQEFEVAIDDAISGARGVRRLVRPGAGRGGARARRGPRGRPGDRVPADARDVRDRRHRDHDAGRRAGARDDGERVHVGLAAPAARARSRSIAARGCAAAARGNAVRRQRARGAPDRALRPLRRPRAATRRRSRCSRSCTTRRSSRVRSRTSSPASCARTGAATTRSSSGRSSSRGTARASRCSSTAAATSGSSRDPRVFSLLPHELLDPILALGEEREYADGEPIMRTGSPAAELLLVLEGTVHVERPGRSLTLGAGRADRRDRGARPGRRPDRGHPRGRGVRCLAISREQLLAALEADPRAAVALIEVLAARFRETA